MTERGMRLKPWMWPATMILVAIAAIAASLVLIDRWGEAAIARQQAAIAAAARDYFTAFAREEGMAPLIATLNRRERVGGGDGFRYALLDAQNHLLAGADVVGSLDTPDAGWRTVAEPGAPGRLWRVLAQPMAGGRTLIVAENLGARDALRGAILRGSMIALTLTALGAAAAGAALHALLLARTRGIAHTAERIAQGDLSARAPERPGGDVFDDLAGSVNTMLTRIEELMTGMRTVTDSLAHDLRSPLTRLKGALARAEAPETSGSERAQAIDQAHQEVDGALSTLSALLDIARAETGLSRDMLQRVDVGLLALEMGELFAPVLEDAGQTLALDVPDAPIIACLHETLLRQAIGNLLHNAAIHAGAGAVVTLSVAETERDGVRIVVADNGPGVPADQLGRVQERFVRLEAARTRPGSGLGLALVAACAKLHRGRLTLEDNGPGLRTVLEAPARA
ncbi:sensor histidine kinase [Phenylobacterium sp.]|uniref:sensor histidine kinase n=1 Tax=Phenylobacterium sp. TaxID=1871053 RepID=UPI0035ADEF66